MNKILIAGPCSAESPEQMMQSAAMLSLINDKAILRAGCWKPRTNPGQFEGHGTTALQWLKLAAENYQLEWMTECGTAEHAEEILHHQGNQLWIGARTSGDPFAVEQIARALAGTQVKVWIKNPPQPDLKLWIGAAERFARHGVSVCGFIHRGFKVYPSGELRNQPFWSLVREMKKEAGDLPIICDPSHMAGKKELVGEIALQAACMDVDGWMIEMHPDVSCALTDKEQQLSPLELLVLWRDLQKTIPSDMLRILRHEIDELDEMLWNILRERFSCTKAIGEYKSQLGLQVEQIERKHQVLQNFLWQAAKAELAPGFSKEIFCAIHKWSVQQQISSMHITPAIYYAQEFH